METILEFKELHEPPQYHRRAAAGPPRQMTAGPPPGAAKVALMKDHACHEMARAISTRSDIVRPCLAAEKNPHQLSPVRVCFHRIKSLAVTYFHIDKVDTSIGAERFHFRVRKGIGWFPLAMAARQNGCGGASHVWPRREFGQFVVDASSGFPECRIQDQSIKSHTRFANVIPNFLGANRLGVIWSSLTGN